MKYLIIIIVGLFPLFSFAQRGSNKIDSISYTKVNGNWIKREYRSEDTPEVFTTIDSLVAKTLVNTQLELSRQLREGYINWREFEKSYRTRIVQNRREYKKNFSGNINVDSLVNAQQLIGNWLLNEEPITITKTFRIKTNKIDFISDLHFEVIIAGTKKTFFKLENNWESDDQMYKLIEVKNN